MSNIPSDGGPNYEQIFRPVSMTPSSSRSDIDQDEGAGSVSGSSAGPWWKGYHKGGTIKPQAKNVGSKKRQKTFVPYDFKQVRKQSTGPKPTVAYCVDFFPFVGPRRPKITRGDRGWDVWKNTAALCAGNKVLIGRCEDEAEGDSWRPVWEIRLTRKAGEPVDELFNVTWSIDPFNLHPLVIAAGSLGLIYILDVAERKLVRVLKGHGDQILALAVCPRLPHILASASRDDTARIWNLYGKEVDMEVEPRSENYAMADADEGNYLVAVLRGQWPGGHRDDVCALSWHPNHRALATASRDHTFKIWAIPPLPPPLVDPPTKGYRPISVSWPLFSTNRLSPSQIDTIFWLDRDIIVIHTVPEIITFHWLSYSRYFQRDKWEPAGHLGKDGYDPGHYSDINDARSFMVISTVETGGHHFYHRAGFHARFTPQPELDRTPLSDLVQDFLLAYPVPGRIPTIGLFAPVQAPPDPVPEVDLRERIDEDDFDFPRSESGDSEQGGDGNGDVNGKGTEAVGPSNISRAAVDASISTEAIQQAASWPTPADTLIPDSDTEPDIASTPNGRKETSKPAKAKHDKAYRWTLKADVWESMVKKHKGPYPLGLQRSDTSTIYCCAISPRGAKWVLGVGLAETIFVWRLREA